MLVGRVVDDEVGDHADAAVARGADQLGEVAGRAEPLVDPVEVGDVVAVVALDRRVERHQPEARDAEAGEVVDALGQADQVAAAVAVRVQEHLDVEAVDDRVLPPQVAGGLAPHRRGRTCSPKASMNGPLLLADVVQVDRVEPELGELVEPRGVPAEVGGDQHRAARRPPAARAWPPRRTARRSRGPSTAAARRRSCATGRARSAAPPPRTAPTTGAPGAHAGPPNASSIAPQVLVRLVDGDQPVGPPARPAARSPRSPRWPAAAAARPAASTASPGRRARARRGRPPRPRTARA